MSSQHTGILRAEVMEANEVMSHASQFCLKSLGFLLHFPSFCSFSLLLLPSSFLISSP